jgi:hypothetical protein
MLAVVSRHMATSETCDHDLEAEYLYPSDVDVLGLSEAGGELHVALAVPCPECDAALRVETAVTSVDEGEFDLPLDDSRYD